MVSTVKNMRLDKTLDPLDLFLNEDDQRIDFLIETIPEEKRLHYHNAGDCFCSASQSKILPEKIAKMFENIDLVYPQALRDYIDEIRSQFMTATTTTVGNLLWKRGIIDSHNPVRFFGAVIWSNDGSSWRGTPSSVRLDLTFGLPMKILTTAEQGKIQVLQSGGYQQPLGHELIMEAWELSANNPRSSLMIAVAAIETGFKEFVSALVPNSGWLVENIPSPPIVKLLQEYLPTLPVKLNVRGHLILPTRSMLETIKVGITLRNEIAHGKRANIKTERLQETIRTIRDILYLLDYYNGQVWAWENIRHETNAELLKSIAN